MILVEASMRTTHGKALAFLAGARGQLQTPIDTFEILPASLGVREPSVNAHLISYIRHITDNLF